MDMNIMRIPAVEGCTALVLRRPDGFAPIGFGAGFLWAPRTADSCFDLSKALGAIFWATWHVQGLLHLLLELCQLLLSSLVALGSHLTTLKCTIVINKMYFSKINLQGKAFASETVLQQLLLRVSATVLET